MYQKIKPHPALSPFIESIWIQESDEDASRRPFPPTHILPTGMIHLIFYYGDPFIHHEDQDDIMAPEFLAFGQITRPFTVSATGRTGIVLACVYPWGAAPLLGIQSSEITNLHLDLRAIFPESAITKLSEKIASAPDNIVRVNSLQAFLFRVLNKEKRDSLSSEAVRTRNNAYGISPISKLAKDLHLSRRHLLRRFKQAVGLSPKMFANVIRFQKAIGLKRLALSWQEITRRCNYYDQAHFISEFRSFSGITPESLPITSPASSLGQSFNCHDLSHFYNTVYL